MKRVTVTSHIRCVNGTCPQDQRCGTEVGVLLKMNDAAFGLGVNAALRITMIIGHVSDKVLRCTEKLTEY